MKRKIIYALTTAVLITSAFLIGRNTTNWADTYCNSSLEITDWNTDGNELSMLLSDDTEIYAYKGDTDHYITNKAYIAFDEITDYAIDANGILYLIDTIGNIYEIRKGEN